MFYVLSLLFLMYMSVLSYSTDITGMLTDHLGEVTEVGIKFSIDGNSLAYYDIFIYLSIFYIVLVFSLPVLIFFGAPISLIYLPSVMGISIYLTFLSLEGNIR